MGGIFSASEFVFDGRSCYEFGLVLCDFDGKGQSDVSFGAKADIVESTTNNRIRPIYHGVNWHGSPLEFTLVFGSSKALERYEMQEVAKWLTGHQDYKWLQICQPDMNTVLYRCIMRDITPITVGWVPYAFEVSVRCDGPYAYGFPFEEKYRVSGSSSVLFRNGGTAREYLKPELTIDISGGEEFRLINHSDGDRAFVLSGLTGTKRVHVDNMNGILTDLSTGSNLYNGFNMHFFRLVRGDNLLEISGKGRLTISGRFLYNVGA